MAKTQIIKNVQSVLREKYPEKRSNRIRNFYFSIGFLSLLVFVLIQNESYGRLDFFYH